MKHWILVPATLLSVVVAAAACDSGNKGANIRSFTANPAILPTNGGQTTLVWEVEGADSLSIEPGVGAVDGSSLTLTVTETTQFQLIAKRNGRIDREFATVTLVPPGSVIGLVRAAQTKVPLPTIAILVNGVATETDENGTFTIPAVSTPYDLVAFDPIQRLAIVFQGLTRFDPTIELPLFDTAGTNYVVPITGTVTPATADPDTTTDVFVDTDLSSFPGSTVANGAGAYSADADWFSLTDAPQPASVIAARYVTDPVTDEITYTHFGREDLSLDPLAAAPVVDVSLTAVANVVTNAVLDDAGFSFSFFGTAFILDTPTGSFADEGITLPTAAVDPTDFTFSISSPDVPGEIALFSQFFNPMTGANGFRIFRFTPGTDAGTVTFPFAATALVPVNNGNGGLDQTFQINARPDSVKIWAFQSATTDIFVVTMSESVTLPSVSDAGIDFTQDASVTWLATEVAPHTSIDDVAGASGLFGPRPELISGTGSRTFNINQ